MDFITAYTAPALSDYSYDYTEENDEDLFQGEGYQELRDIVRMQEIAGEALEDYRAGFTEEEEEELISEGLNISSVYGDDPVDLQYNLAERARLNYQKTVAPPSDEADTAPEVSTIIDPPIPPQTS